LKQYIKQEEHRQTHIRGITCNIRKPADVTALMEFTLKTFGKINFLVNNGGGQFPSPAEAISDKGEWRERGRGEGVMVYHHHHHHHSYCYSSYYTYHPHHPWSYYDYDSYFTGWHAVIDTNLTGTFTCCREVFEVYMGEHGGAIVNIIADMFKGFPGMMHTGAARAGVDNMTKTLAVEWAQAGIRVNAVAPGIIYSKTAAANYKDDDFLVGHRRFIPLKRLGTVEEVASMVCFLLSPAAAFVTGTTIRVDGGGSIAPTFWNIPDHNKVPPYGRLPPTAKL
jgi:peroxisomal trans-2-enoyl-CoA reductase